MRVQLHERCFRRKPDKRIPVDEVRARLSHDTSGALGGVTDEARFRRTGSDIHLGRERPPKTRPGTVIGGWQRESLTPQMTPSLLLTAAPTATRAAQSAARCIATKSHTATNMADQRGSQRRGPGRVICNEQLTTRREHRSRVCVPPFVQDIHTQVAYT